MWDRSENQMKKQICDFGNTEFRNVDVSQSMKKEQTVTREICMTFIRHGATASNREGRYLGKTDESLSEEGTKALQQYKEAKGYPAADILFSSPMKRCLETVQILYPGQTRIPIQIPEWTEMDFGVFEGHNYKELSGDPGYQQWIDSGGTMPFPEGESREEFIQRSVVGFEHMLQDLRMRHRFVGESEHSNRDWGKGSITEQEYPAYKEREKEIQNVSAVVHGGTIMALLSHFLGGDYFDYQVKCGQGYTGRLVFTQGTKEPVWVDWKTL